jgi:ABC-type amino acid transport substrate-binding protein
MERPNQRGVTAAAVVAAVISIADLSAGSASAGVVDRISQDKTIRIAYREDAPPFSYKDKIGEPVGFMVDLCREVAKKLAQQLSLASLSVIYVPVTAAGASRPSNNKEPIFCASQRALPWLGASWSISRFRRLSTVPD